MIAVHCFISGRVQGVSFRYYTRREAIRLGITGWVRNVRGGKVEVLAYGEPATIAQFQQWLHQGPPSAQVEEINCQSAQISDSYTTFEVIS